eukprot:12443518-Heterocapsa_arctica.AAC.1
MRVQLAKLPEVRVIVVDYMVIDHCKNANARQTERTLWRQQVQAYLTYQEWDNFNIPCGNRDGPLQDDDLFDPGDVIVPGLMTGGYPNASAMVSEPDVLTG